MERTVARLRAEFQEMPGLHLTRDQIQRFCGVGEEECREAVAHLVRAKFLYVKEDGAYARLTGGPVRQRYRLAYTQE
jgi:hypothetical protein